MVSAVDMVLDGVVLAWKPHHLRTNQPPPLILRERPPRVPASIASQTVIRRLAALPVPPRSVIIERLPPLPPRPRDVIIERWVPYGPQAKRRTVVQRAGAAHQYARPRNVIIQYEPAQVRVIRQFQRLGVTQASPQAYLQQYGHQLLDAATLVSQARSAGVVEDISAPGGYAGVAGGFSGGVVGYGGSTYGQDYGGFGSSSSFESSGYGGYSGGASFDAGLSGVDAYGSAGYGVSSGYGAGWGGAGLEASSSAYESSSYGGGYGGGSYGGSYGGGSGFDVASAVFRSVDTNNDGTIDANEFNRFYQQGL